MKILVCSFFGLIAASSLNAAVIGYWRFEDSEFYTDSGPQGITLSNGGGTAIPTQVAIPGSGNGSKFPTSVPSSGATNGSAASFDSTGNTDRFTAPDNELFTDSTFTVEAFISTTSLVSAQKTIAGQWNSTGDERSWLFGLGNSNNLNFLFSTDGTAATQGTVTAFGALSLNTDYYVAVTVNMADTSANGITFYVKNLTTGTELQSAGATHNGSDLYNSDQLLTIGSTNQPSAPWVGLLDEVRISDGKLSASELLIVPEPASVTLLGIGALVLGLRRRR